MLKFNCNKPTTNAIGAYKEKENKMKRLMIIIGLVILAIIGIMLMIRGVEAYGVNMGVILLALIITYLIFSYTIVHVGHVGMMTEWGKPIGKPTLTPTWYFTPLGIVSVRIEKGTVFQDELPADPEKIYRLPKGAKDDGKIPEGMFPPIRVKFGQPKEKDDPRLKDDPYNVAMVAEVVPVVSWRINNATMFFTVMGDVTNCRQILADKAVELFGDQFANVTPAKAALRLNKTSEKLEKMLIAEAKANGWGIEIRDAYVKPFIFTHELNTSVVNVSIAQQNAKATVHAAEGAAKAVEIAAEAEKMRLIKTGLAKKDATGEIIELSPDANTRVTTDAVKELAKVTGTLVLGGDLKTMLDVGKEKNK